jgi:hypothetical protein
MENGIDVNGLIRLRDSNLITEKEFKKHLKKLMRGNTRLKGLWWRGPLAAIGFYLLVTQVYWIVTGTGPRTVASNTLAN